MDYSQILPSLFVGTHPKTAEDIGRLKADGVTGVLNLQTQEDFDFHSVDWPKLRAKYFVRNVAVRRVPIRDFDDDELREKLPEAVEALGELLNVGHMTYIHCNVGVNRSPSVVITYLHWSLGWRLDDAERHVRKCHSCSPVMDVILLATRDRQRRLV